MKKNVFQNLIEQNVCLGHNITLHFFAFDMHYGHEKGKKSFL